MGDYTFHETALSGLTLGAGVRYTGSTYGDEANTFKVPDYTVWNTVIKYDLARFNLPGSSVALNVNNLFDKEYVSSCFATYGCFWGQNVKWSPRQPSVSNRLTGAAFGRSPPSRAYAG